MTKRTCRKPRRAALVFAAVSAMSTGCAELQSALPIADVLLGGTGSTLDASTVAAGLKDALRVGTERTVGTTSSVDGFLGNALIRIAMPEQLSTMATALRAVGMGAQVDNLEVSMNRAAEQAAGEARSVFWDQITSMTVTDAFGILNGGDTAATDYFRARTSDTLRSRFGPIVQNKMKEVGLYNTYNQLSATYNAMPFVTTPALNLDEYVTDNALDGLFTVLATEETRIRQDPAARTTDLLRTVFGR